MGNCCSHFGSSDEIDEVTPLLPNEGIQRTAPTAEADMSLRKRQKEEELESKVYEDAKNKFIDVFSMRLRTEPLERTQDESTYEELMDQMNSLDLAPEYETSTPTDQDREFIQKKLDLFLREIKSMKFDTDMIRGKMIVNLSKVKPTMSESPS
ncbi:Ragulator complex subunit, LAMTOR1-like protein [Schizosaccharomyces osmophilus]|uniref:Ragulator complex subunit, LAMTOR1-like protein n=1 Tax=Schizosaccharomyces osmophilus TaxID=2545709 RepID=A0AAF0AXJ6_9SCHI|nr:Ragulator complex subunit, LAMTOR1-like protein [Schizosaccharomyces osmophilus]WBW73894.1 Ragulator complex subunit, LAMTOR1-like protein [Schizosaccharomyces osmophilus]